ncbi:RICIN domain-containing protein [Dactylosporangium sp. NPDC005572]|uniref:RICIN domain-containing protein n=1 Tax=Dactylosporangium sp. NPDC005572 TaxID=3156889 RepID=UPI0033BF8E79
MRNRIAVLLAATMATALLVGSGVAAAATAAPTSLKGGMSAAKGGGVARLAAEEPNDYGPYVIENMITHYCVDIPGYGPGYVNAPVTQFTCNYWMDDDNQFFWFKYVQSVYVPSLGYDRDLYTIRNVDDDLCLDVSGYGWVAPGAKVSEYYCNHSNSDNQLYYEVSKYVAGTYVGRWFVNYKSGLCLDVEGYANGGPNTRLGLYTCSMSDDHLWTIR